MIALGGDPGPGLFSKYCRYVTCRSLSQPSVLIEAVTRIAGSLLQRPILLASSDEAARTIALNKGSLEQCADVPIFSRETTAACLNKSGIHDAAERLGVPQPVAYFPDVLDELSRVAGSIDYPCVLKPDNTKELYRILGVKALMVRSRDELFHSYNAITRRRIRVFVQEYIPGETEANYGFAAYFDKDSRPHCVVTYRRLGEWPPDSFGIAAQAVSVDVPELFEQAINFFSGLRFHGVAQAEFKRDSRDNKWKIIDVNPRAWTSNRLATRCGCNIPYAAYQECIGMSFGESRMRPAVKWANFPDALFSDLYRWPRGQLSRSQGLMRTRGEVVHAVYDWRDPGPFVWLLRNGNMKSRLAKFLRTWTSRGRAGAASARNSEVYTPSGGAPRGGTESGFL